MILQPKPGIDVLELVNVVCYPCYSFPSGDYTTYSLNQPYLFKCSNDLLFFLVDFESEVPAKTKLF